MEGMMRFKQNYAKNNSTLESHLKDVEYFENSGT
jgi:hypothetical protein